MTFRYLLALPLIVSRTTTVTAFSPISSLVPVPPPRYYNTSTQAKHLTKSILKSRQKAIMADSDFVNATERGDIPTFDGSEKAKATDFANYFCSYAQLYHQKQMLADHNRMAAYHSAILGNSEVFKDKVVMDVGTGSGILAVWAAQAGAKRVYAGEILFLCCCILPFVKLIIIIIISIF